MTEPEAGSFYISTAIPYVNAAPHIGFAFEVVLTDAIARYFRARGRDVFFLTGTDDNSLKNVEAAEKRGIATEDLVEENAQGFRALRESLDLSFDDFIRTSKETRHFASVEAIWKACAASGDIYEAEYEGLYCVGCEQFYSPEDLVDELCPEHLRPPEAVRERNWFFRLARYQDRLIELIESNQLQIWPDARRAEILSFMKGGLQDFSISRAATRSRGWGIPVPDDPSQIIYVWFDALINYVSALNHAGGSPAFQRYWVGSPRRIHVVGKGILRFHAAYWPAMLLSAGVPLPTTIAVHGYLLTEGQKISKSRGGGADPHELSQRFGTDSLRYYLLSQFKPASDGDFSVENLTRVHDNDLSDQLGNLVSRVVAMVQRYYGGRVPAPADPVPSETLNAVVTTLLDDVDRHVENFEIDEAVRRVWRVVREANRYVVSREPWALAKQGDSSSQAKLATTLYELVEVIRIVTAFASPFIPSKAQEIARVLSLPEGWERLSHYTTRWGMTVPGTALKDTSPLFPKLGGAR